MAWITVDGCTRWTESIAQKVKRKKKVEDNSRKEIYRSVFEPSVVAYHVDSDPVRRLSSPAGLRLTKSCCSQLKTLDHKLPMTREDFDR